jgi:hypothetical protein
VDLALLKSLIFCFLEKHYNLDLICCAIALFYITHTHWTHKFIYLLMLLNPMVDFAAFSIGHIYKNNLWLYNLYVIAQFVLFIVLYHTFFIKNFSYKVLQILTIFALVASIFFYTKSIKGNELNAVGIMVQNLCIATLSYFLIKQTIVQLDANPFRQVAFWFSLSGLCYCIGSLALYGTFNWFTLHNSALGHRIYKLNNVLLSSWYILITIALIVCRPMKQK